jgi:uncharacterized protein (AIM24 family)
MIPPNTITAVGTPDRPLLVRPGCFLSHPEATLVMPHPRRMLFRRLSQGMFVLFRVTNGEFTLSAPFANAYVTRIDLGPSDVLFLPLDHVLAFTESSFPAKLWKIDIVSMIMGRLSYTYFRGPGTLYVCGIGGLLVQEVDGSEEYDSRRVLGWTHALRVGVASKHSWLTAFMGKAEVCLDRFVGQGKVVVQTATTPISAVERLEGGGAGASVTWFDILSAIIGIPLPRL